MATQVFYCSPQAVPQEIRSDGSGEVANPAGLFGSQTIITTVSSVKAPTKQGLIGRLLKNAKSKSNLKPGGGGGSAPTSAPSSRCPSPASHPQGLESIENLQHIFELPAYESNRPSTSHCSDHRPQFQDSLDIPIPDINQQKQRKQRQADQESYLDLEESSSEEDEVEIELPILSHCIESVEQLNDLPDLSLNNESLEQLHQLPEFSHCIEGVDDLHELPALDFCVETAQELHELATPDENGDGNGDEATQDLISNQILLSPTHYLIPENNPLSPFIVDIPRFGNDDEYDDDEPLSAPPDMTTTQLPWTPGEDEGPATAPVELAGDVPVENPPETPLDLPDYVLAPEWPEDMPPTPRDSKDMSLPAEEGETASKSLSTKEAPAQEMPKSDMPFRNSPPTPERTSEDIQNPASGPESPSAKPVLRSKFFNPDNPNDFAGRKKKKPLPDIFVPKNISNTYAVARVSEVTRPSARAAPPPPAPDTPFEDKFRFQKASSGGATAMKKEMAIRREQQDTISPLPEKKDMMKRSPREPRPSPREHKQSPQEQKPEHEEEKEEEEEVEQQHIRDDVPQDREQRETMLPTDFEVFIQRAMASDQQYKAQIRRIPTGRVAPNKLSPNNGGGRPEMPPRGHSQVSWHRAVPSPAESSNSNKSPREVESRAESRQGGGSSRSRRGSRLLKKQQSVPIISAVMHQHQQKASSSQKSGSVKSGRTAASPSISVG